MRYFDRAYCGLLHGLAQNIISVYEEDNILKLQSSRCVCVLMLGIYVYIPVINVHANIVMLLAPHGDVYFILWGASLRLTFSEPPVRFPPPVNLAATMPPSARRGPSGLFARRCAARG